MKVFELLTPNQLKYKQLKTPIKRKWNALTKPSLDRHLAGSGVYADVYEPEKDPGAVDKIARPEYIDSLSSDPYYQYLDTISKNDRITSNPYFPKIFSLKTYRGADGKYTYKVNMEKLNDSSTLSFEEAVMLGRRLFADYDAALKRVRQLYTRNMKKKPTGNATQDAADNEMYNDLSQRAAIKALSTLMNDAIKVGGEVSTNILDPKLKQALMLIRKIVDLDYDDPRDFTPDIHTGNFMIRRGPFIPQIVITDPIA